ncbi:MAG: hypothetical protein AAFP17_06610 [Pseudomonadota bacterium]
MSSRYAFITLFVACLLTWPQGAHADTWQSRALVDGVGVANITLGRIRLQLMCHRGAEREVTTVIAARGLPEHFRKETDVVFEIDTASGTARQHAGRMVLADGGQALTGSLPLASGFLDDFARGNELRIITKGRVMLRSSLRGTAKARAAFRQICGV